LRGRSLSEAERSITDYDRIFEDCHEINWGDPAAFGRIVLDVIDAKHPPRRPLVGLTAFAMVAPQIHGFGN
jgi:hypothetical protein